MTANYLEGREALTTRLNNQLNELVGRVETAGKNNLSSSHVVAETILAGLLNRIYDWDLVNANATLQNCPGVDLIDVKNKIAVQVTATCTPEKVRHTLRTVEKSGLVYNTLIILVITQKPVTSTMKALHKEIWNKDDLFRDAKELSIEKLTDITEYLLKEMGGVKKELPHLYLPLSSTLQTTGFLGREKELAEIQSRFARGDNLVFLTGLGGIGKTELAVQYGRKHSGAVYYARFDTSFTRTLAKMAMRIRPKLAEEELCVDDEILLKKVQALMEQFSTNDLLIIDNVDSDTASLVQLQSDPGYKIICDLRIKILMTTRSEAPRAIIVKALPEDHLFEIFRIHGAELSEVEMRNLIRAVNRHTLTVDLIARTLADNYVPVSVQEMLDAITNSTLSEGQLPEISTDYYSNPDSAPAQPNDNEQQHIYQLLRSVFQVAKIPALEQQLLRLATLLPDTGMDVRLFRSALNDELLRVVQGLGKRGWLSADHQMLTIHPVVRMVCWTELKPTDEDCTAFLEKLFEQYDKNNYNYVRYRQIAVLLDNASVLLTDESGRWAFQAGVLWDTIGSFIQAQSCNLRAKRKMEERLSQNDPQLAQVYRNVGGTYGNLGNHQKALEYKLKALKIQETAFPEQMSVLAAFYNDVGYTYGRLGNHSLALEFKLKALDIYRNTLSPEDPVLAQSYNNVGSTYSDLHDYQQALEYQQKALQIRKKALSPEHRHLALSYSNVGYTYYRFGNYHQALEYQKKALQIWEKALPPMHPLLATCCHDIGQSYHEWGQLEIAAQFMRRAADIIGSSALPNDHPRRINYPKLADQYEKEAGIV